MERKKINFSSVHYNLNIKLQRKKYGIDFLLRMDEY